MNNSLISGLERDAMENRSLADQCIHAPKAKALYTGMASRCEEAVKALRALQYPDARIAGSFPVVLYFATDSEREDFIRILQLAKPNLTSTSL